MGKAKKKFTVLRDTGEHKGYGWVWEPADWCAGTESRNLYTADYSLEGYYDNKVLAVERKGSVVEFAQNLTHAEKWDDFKQLLERMEEFRFPYLVLEFPLSLLKAYPVGSGIPKFRWPQLKFGGDFLLKRVIELEFKFRTRIHFAGDSTAGKQFVTSLFKRVMEQVPCPC